MRSVTLALALLTSLAAAGCSGKSDSLTEYDAPKPLDKMSNEEWCAYYGKFLTNPQLTPTTRALDIQRMRARGCATPPA